MTREEIVHEIKEIICDRHVIDESEISDTSLLVGDFGFDDLDVVELAMEIEVKFDIEMIDNEVIDSWNTLGSVVDYVVKTLTV